MEFSNEFALLQHQCGQSSNKCKVCKKDCGNKLALSQHIQDVHSEGSGGAVASGFQARQGACDVRQAEWQARQKEREARQAEWQARQDAREDRQRWIDFCEDRMRRAKKSTDRQLWFSRRLEARFFEDVDVWIEFYGQSPH